jgi:hypothetical protein
MTAAAAGANDILQGKLPPDSITTTLLTETQAVLKAVTENASVLHKPQF